MKQYIFSIIAVCVVGSVVSILSPEGEGGGIARHTRLVFGLCVILVCFSPLTQAIQWIRDFDIGSVLPDGGDVSGGEYESIFEGTYGEAEVENLKEGIISYLSEHFGIDQNSVSVSVRFSGDSHPNRLQTVFITLYDSAIFADTSAIESQLSSLLRCEIVTIIG